MSSSEIIPVNEKENGVRLDRWFKRHYPRLTHSKLEKLLRTGQIRLDSCRVKSNARLCEGQQIRIPPILQRSDHSILPIVSASISKLQIDKLRRSVLYMDEYIIGINKPAGLAVQGGSKVRKNLDSMLDVLTFDADERPRLVHRLDKDTSGVLILARNREAAAMLGEAFRSKQTRKVYWAIVKGVPKSLIGKVDLPLVKKVVSGSDKVMVDPNGKQAITRYRVIEKAGERAAWLALEPITGRTHQLRVHCNQLGTPILGDGKYGGSMAFFNNNVQHARKLQLHAKAIRFSIPNGTKVEISAPLPEHMVQIWRFLGFDENGVNTVF